MAAEVKQNDANEDLSAFRNDLISRLDNFSISINYDPILLNPDETPKRAMELLLQSGTRAAPVCKVGVDGKREFLGVADLRDLIGDVVSDSRKEQQKQEQQNTFNVPIYNWFTSSLTNAAKKISYFAKMKPFAVINMKDADNPTKEEVNVIMKAFGSKGNHIVGVVGENGKFGVLSQAEFYKSVVSSMNKTKNDLNRATKDGLTVSTFLTKYGGKQNNIKVVKSDETVYDAFSRMSDAKKSGLPVLEDGEIRYNISVTDVKFVLGLQHHYALNKPNNANNEQKNNDDNVQVKFPFHIEKRANLLGIPDGNMSKLKDIPLDTKVGDFVIAKLRDSDPKKETRYPIVTISKAGSMKTVLGMLLSTGYHRIWVTEDNKPIGVISMTDIFTFLSDN